ncbi:MAG: hypothetical protein JO115_02280 [Pseudonocardiales bacterium]|nr:hypothetical protein [Pseudonocardiales bacterium]
MSSNAGPRHRAPSRWCRAFLRWRRHADRSELVSLAQLLGLAPDQLVPLAKPSYPRHLGVSP